MDDDEPGGLEKLENRALPSSTSRDGCPVGCLGLGTKLTDPAMDPPSCEDEGEEPCEGLNWLWWWRDWCDGGGPWTGGGSHETL